ncbi:branched-chain amino acid ABC transporter permease [Nocardia higoensis]|uniref:Branched-chain amino acid ABC transporter permease n=1 Tax=Nocardia higoensis TaxID=228599 RepID=A0ABS0D4M0_9NOCA|nr:branched-chain amino acid ABC transporter permease [Nocardia higoensis]MBF6353030.1 branched-chain amino acid ABC transporter permease [Nocardia higoensis]
MKRPLVVERGSARYRALMAGGLFLLVALILWGSGLAPFELGQVTRVMIFAIAITGLNLATGYVGMLSVGHSAFFGLGAYTTGILVVSYDWQAFAAIPVAFVVCLVAGLLVGLPALRIRGLYLAMVTLAFAVAFPELVAHFSDLTGGSSGLMIRRADLTPPAWSGFTLGQKDLWLYWLTVALLIATVALIAALVRSRYGMALAAVRENEIAASASGVNIAVVKTTMFGLSGAVTGVAGALFAMYMGSLFAEGSFTLLAGITLLIGLVIGGERTIAGPVVGAVVVVYVPYLTAEVGAGQAASVLFAISLLAVIFLAPSGAVGGMTTLTRKFVVLAPRGRPKPPAPPAPDALPARSDATDAALSS